jgi:hypothetical protein
MLKVVENKGTHRSLAQIFSASNFRRFVKNNDTSSFDYKINKHITSSSQNSYSNVVSFLYKELESRYRSEYFYKNALLTKKLLGCHSLNTTTVLDEFKINSSIADFVLLNGEVKLFEIKTDLDSFDKLEKQISDYQKFANKVYVVVGNKHSEKLANQYSNSPIGVIEFTTKNTLRTIKEASSDTSKFEHETIFKTLRKQEYSEIIIDYFNIVLDVPNTKIFKASLEIIKTIDIELFQKLAFNKLKERRLKCPALLESDSTPNELKHICYTLNLSEGEYSNLHHFLNQTV